MAKSKTKCIGILTSGGDCPGLNAAIRGVVKPALNMYNMKVIGVLDGFRGLVENRTIPLDDKAVSGILTLGGTFLGTGRNKPHKMPMGDKVIDMTDVAVENASKMQMDCLVCLGGGGTQKNALRLREAGLNVLTLPKTIDNDVAVTEITFGFDTAMTIAAEAIDRLHTTATSHHRVIVCEIMGHSVGWLALGAGIAGGADVILLPEVPYDLDVVAEHLLERRRNGKRFSIIAVAEGAISKQEAKFLEKARENRDSDGKKKKSKKKKKVIEDHVAEDYSETTIVGPDGSEVTMGYHVVKESKASRLARELQQLTGTEARVTALGHVQRGGTPSATDRLLCTRLGTTATALLARGMYNVMVAVKGDGCVPVNLEEVAGKKKTVSIDHDWIKSALMVDTCLGEKL